MKLFVVPHRLKRKRHPQTSSDEPLLDTPEKRANVLKQIAAGIAMNKPGAPR
jgi:hypothetical protein